MKWKQFLLIVITSSISAAVSVFCYSKFVFPKTITPPTHERKLTATYTGYIDNNNAFYSEGSMIDFTEAAASSIPAVVHIRTKIPPKKVNNKSPNEDENSIDDLFNKMFNLGPDVVPEQRGSGSGVLISDDGYIVTNNHVIATDETGNAISDEISVTLSNRKTFKARLIGRDPSSDLAVIKIDGNDFPFLTYSNSDEAKVGQWVLAVGYPLTLEATVTAGIISAKGRSIGINRRQSSTPIESFIQTDAAINYGNSGGALINTDGELVGVVSSFLGSHGTYAGYSFAIPVNLVKKIVKDLMKYGSVRLPYLGVQAEKENPDAGDGVHIGSVTKNGPAETAGIKAGDIITKINDVPVRSWTELFSIMASYNAGDKIKISFTRDGEEQETDAILAAKAVVKDEEDKQRSDAFEKSGAVFKTAGEEMTSRNNIKGGVIITDIKEDSPFRKARIDEGFIITRVDRTEINTIEDFERVLSTAKKTVRLEGIFDGSAGTYIFPLSLNDKKE